MLMLEYMGTRMLRAQANVRQSTHAQMGCDDNTPPISPYPPSPWCRPPMDLQPLSIPLLLILLTRNAPPTPLPTNLQLEVPRAV